MKGDVLRVASIVGARPQFIKLAPLVQAIKSYNSPGTQLSHLIIHTGQHYDYEMSKVFFDELRIPEPNYHLGVGSASHGYQTGEILKRTEEVLLKGKPDWVLVYGDTNSTLAGALAAAKLYIPVTHIEAGLRSYNKNMPEEINRVLTDHCSDILFCPTKTAVKNLEKQGFINIVNEGKLIGNNFYSDLRLLTYNLPLVINVGDIMYDAFLMSLEIAEKKSTILSTLDIEPKSYYLITVHRAENTDNPDKLINILEALIEISKQNPVIFPIHPRTKKALSSLALPQPLPSRLNIIDSTSYFDMLILEKHAIKILTDSGGVQKEAYWLKVPCITLREQTEWVETVEAGWNVVVGTDKKRIIESIVNTSPITDCISQKLYGDGKTAKKIIRLLREVKE